MSFLINSYRFQKSTSWTANNATLSALDSNLVAYWDLDANSNDKVGSNNGTDTDISYVAGKYNNCADFNGSSSQISLGTLALTGAHSFSFWVNPDALANTFFQTQIDSTGFIIFIESNELRFGFRGVGKRTTGLSLTTGSWQHVVVTYNGGTKSDNGSYTAYVDGAGGSISNSSTIGGSALDTFIGSEGGGAYFNGKIDETFIPDRVITSTEVTALYNSETGSFYQ